MRTRDIIDIYQPQRPFFDALALDIGEAMGVYVRKGALDEAASYQRDMISVLDRAAGESMWSAWRKAVRAQWKNPAAATAWKARALNLDENDPHMAIAVAPFAPMKVGGEWKVAIPTPIPCPMGSKFGEPDDILLIHPATGAASLYSGDTDTLIEAAPSDRFTVLADAKTWAREIAATAVEWLYRCDQARRIANIKPEWGGFPPSSLAIGEISKIIWPRVTAITAGAGVDAAKLKKVIFKQARITHVEAPLALRSAA